jgi:hypothetical protein
MQPLPLPALVTHADWGSAAAKRYLAMARLQPDGSYIAEAPQQVDNPDNLLRDLFAASGEQTVLLGFDFPIGFPRRYAALAGVSSLLQILPILGKPGTPWEDFFKVAETPEQISLRRPFYPLRPGQARQAHLLAALSAPSMDDLRRRCDLGYPGRRPAAPIFWTLGGQQVGKAAIHGWREVIIPAMQAGDPPLGIWPFSGPLGKLLDRKGLVIAETYPAEFYHQIGVRFSPPRRGEHSGKRSSNDRAANAGVIEGWAAKYAVHLERELLRQIRSGFAHLTNGDDPFDATIGLLGMIGVLRRPVRAAVPPDALIQTVEGWIMGQAG